MSATAAPPQSQSGRIWGRFRRHRLALAGGIVVALLLASALFAPLLAPQDPTLLDTALRFRPPFTDWHFPLGTDELGRDTLSRLLWGGRVSLTVGLVAMVTTVMTGALIGITAGFIGGFVDTLLMRFVDTMLCFPQVFLPVSYTHLTLPTKRIV